MNRNHTPVKFLLLFLLSLVGGDIVAQTRHWVGGNGSWNDALHWSAVAGGQGGASVPRMTDDVFIAVSSAVRIDLVQSVSCRALHIDATHAAVHWEGPAKAVVNIAGAWSMRGDVQWNAQGPVRLGVRQEGVEVDTRGTSIAGDVVFDGSGSWSLISDLRTEGVLRFEEGTVMANGTQVTAQRMVFSGHGRERFIAGSAVVALEQAPDPVLIRDVVDVASSSLVVNGVLTPWGLPAGVLMEDRDINVCGTGAGQTPFTVNAQLITNFNGYGVRCRGGCGATVTASVTGGSGNFSFQWLGGGPPTATWTNACGGPQLVIVTDITQGISCPAQVNVTEPAPLGVIFFGQGTPPTCADACNGTRSALAIGGVTPHTYNWNNGAGSGSSFSNLCAGVNTLRITDANGCVRDTTFIFNILPIAPNLTFTPANCFGDCDGTATVAPSGGTGTYTITWTPTPAVQGASSLTNLCAGSYSVNVRDGNNCDSTVTFIIAQPPAITVTSSVTGASCATTCNGSATVTAGGTAGPYTYLWNPAPGGGQNTNAATGLCGGPYTVRITDTPTGCDTLITIIVPEPPPFAVVATVNDATCSNACDGTIALTVTGGTPGYTFLWSPVPATGQGTANVSGLCPGSHQVTVADVAGCDTVLVFTVLAPPPVVPTLTLAGASCAGVCDGTATATVTGGTSPYTYLWAPAPPVGQGTSSVSGLCDGPYTLTVTDAASCDTTINFIITEPPPIIITPTQTNVTCGTLCDGTASVAVAGGTPGYTYQWTPAPGAGQGTANATGLCAGTYNVLVTDANGCTLTQAFTILDAAPILISLQLAPASCNDVCDGSAGVIVTGGVAPYTYDWDPLPGAGQGTANVTGLCAQAYSLTIADAVGCDTTIAFTITAPPPIVPNAGRTDVTCAGACDGTITLAPTGGTGIFTYNWVPQPAVGQGTLAVSGLCAGDWSVTITSGGCDTTVTMTLTEPPALQADLVMTDASCAGICDGSATATVTGGAGPYAFTWAPPPAIGQGTATAEGLCAGPHTLTVTDANGCDTLLNFTISEPPPLLVTPTQTNVTCGALCDGTASVSVGGGTPGYTYLWTPVPANGQGTATATGLCAGAYAVLITDANGCTFTRSFTILGAVPLQISLQLTPASCADVCDGTAGVIVTGGVSPYNYLWAPLPGGGQGGANVTGLCAQAYTLTITDAVGCDSTISFTITAPPPIVPNPAQTDVTCAGGCNGTIVLAPAGGTGTYTYNWVPAPPLGQGTANAGGLCAGDWNVTITSGACDTTITITILAPPPIHATIAVTNVSCAGSCDGTADITASGGTPPLAYNWSPVPPVGQGTAHVEGLCPGSYSVTVSDAAGCDTLITFDVLAPGPIVPSLVTTPETCAGPCSGTASVSPSGGTGTIVVDWQPAPGGGQGTLNATGLCAGVNYQVTLTDGNGCDTTVAFIIDSSATIIPNSSSTPASCNGVCDGTATVGPTGGATPYTFLWSPPPPVGQGTPSASGLCAGTWEVTITDAGGCSIVAEVLITEPSAIVANAVVTDPLCAAVCDGTVVLNTTGGTGPYTYDWSPAPPNGQGTSTITGLCAGTWNVTITDALGCRASSSHTVVEPAPLTLSTSATPSECQVCIGTATATIGGGTGVLQVEWRNALNVIIGTAETVTDLCAGIYMVTVRDENGCTIQHAVPITDSDGEELTTVDGTTTCPNTCDGEASVNFTCNDAPCTITWTDANGVDLGSSSNILGGLCPGEYYVSVANASGCVTIDTATVVAPIVLTLNTSSTPVSCTGQCDGTATIGVVGGTPPFTFSWDPAPATGQGTPAATGLCAGVYTVTVGDGGGCETTAQVLITEPQPLVLFSSIIIDASCSGTCDGNITLLVTGGTAPYAYAWSPAPASGQGTSAAFGLCAGNVSVSITDANGCTLDRTFTVTEPQPLVVSVSTTQSTCPNCDGTATATVTGGTGPYTFSWMLGGTEVSTDQAPNGLCGGVYQLTVRDAFGCAALAVAQVQDSNAEVLVPVDGATLCANLCDGSVSVDFTCSAPACTTQWMDVDGNVIAQGTTVLNNLCAGTYTVQVTNANGCVSLADAVVSPSTTIIPNLSTTAASCAGACDGTATVGPVGGVAPYTFTWDPPPGGGVATPQATGLCAGVYTVLIEDASGCDTTVQVLILEPQPLDQQAAITDVSCSGACDGSVVVTPSGGTAPYTFFWDPLPSSGQGSNGAFDLCGGDHVLLLTDANGCTLERTWTVATPAPIDLSGGSISSECGVCNGEAFVSASGGTGTYTYLWTQNNSIFGTSDSLTALCAGFYQVLVTDGAGCPDSLLVPVQDLNGEVLTATGDTVSCPGVCDGNAQVVFNCGEPSCTVAWYDAFGTDLNQTTNGISSACAGDYLVMVTNGLGCISIDTATVASPEPIIPNLSTTPVSCFGTCDGTATVAPTGGVPPYQYTWTPAPLIGQGTPNADGLCAGVNEVSITDASGCTIVVPVLILSPDQLTADVALVPITCNGACDGSIVLTPQGGTGGYTFAWNPVPPSGQGNNAATDLCAGDWSVVITDANGCDTLITITLVDPPVLDAVLTTTNNACYGECDGTATVVITGGVPDYSIVWTDATGAVIAQDTVQVDGLCAGDLTVTITDANGCVRVVPFSITEGSAIDAALTFTGETCAGPCDGVASVVPTGGTGPYTILWSPEPGAGQGTGDVTGLCAGNYSVTISDALGCDTTYVFTIAPYTPIVDGATLSDVRCHGACDGSVLTSATGGIGVLSYQWSPVPPNGQGDASATQLCPGEYLLVIADGVGCDSSFAYTIEEPPALELSVDVITNASCADASDGAISITATGGMPSYTFEWTGPDAFSSAAEDITGIHPGAYQLVLNDANNCMLDTVITVDALTTVEAIAGADQQACSGTTVTLDGSASVGGTSYSWRDAQGVEVGTTPVVEVSGLPDGHNLFTLVVTDGPCSSTDQVSVTVLSLPIANAGVDQTIFLGGTVALGGSPTGPVGSLFLWTPDSLLSDLNASNPTANPTITTWFAVTVTAPNGCTATDSVLVTVVPTVVIPNGFTPNADGRNDTWVIDFIELFPDCEVEVYNRWGDQLFRSVGYNQPWDGKYRDGFVPVGTYYYVIELNDERFPEPYTGPLTVIR
ncbi:MAG: gliding motility-associated C-terminal domain-containing protein [Flavobacteriales bacterium]|nr:gliding motility-associated C-terminal domain-containing protein [Flavobacteriales bacterium]